jgi:hypothetical protein
MSNIKCPPGFRRSHAKGHHAGCVKPSKRSGKRVSKQSKKRSGKRSAKKSGKKSKKGSSRGNIRCPPGYKKVKGRGCQSK